MNNSFKEKLKNIDYIACIGKLVIVGALIVVCMISMLSEFGVHPDEWDVKSCMDWGMNHWIWPDMRAEGLGDTYSGYGYTKVCNYTPYFLIMGKIAYVFKLFMDVLPYYRVPNLLLMLLMSYIMFKDLKDKKYLLLAFGMSVQAWYIFSYVTADALDFVWAFVAILLLADKSSLLWNTVNPSNTKNIIRNCIMLGLLYGMMLLGKPYYYANMVLTFIVLVIHMTKSSFSDMKILWKRYIIIVCVCGLVFAGRFGLDLHYYGAEKSQVKEQMSEIYSSEDKKLSADASDLNYTYHMASKGYSVADLFKYEPDWFKKSFRSFAGARMTTEGDEWYFTFMGVWYLVIYIWIIWGIITNYKEATPITTTFWKNEDVMIAIFCTSLNIGGVVASIMNSYLIDSQPQGRYLLPIALTTCYLGSRTPKLWKNKIFCTFVILASVVSLMYFGLFDSRKLIDLAYVRSLFGQ